MILRYEHLIKFPTTFQKLTGLDVARFDALLAEISPYYSEAERQRLSRPDRIRAIGGGDHSDMDLCDKVLLTLIWQQQYPKQEVLGYFFGISQPTVWRNIRQVQPVLEQAEYRDLCQPDPGRKRRRDLASLLAEIPELVFVISRYSGMNSWTNRSVALHSVERRHSQPKY